ncbi:phosphate signaling complex protein PhoU [Leptolyngbya cf. ectocarpi LEGE 11479]|uniref:Phosphate-specific transport system accessory protein PhoU n=1 Tax=Leptolyngbya cf. ectocarpi LEGE 11479 TaxID=1828722 RepID=A0A928ZS26_LEPEC|nr:phosphate signaling complex protein PhoU [Leptolyngbya ectocarpi]MBE9065487.1 phosphate signaling complex protein PhoU [Leptolyngbya cf. ectocarpi LEGE 11479]
MNIASNSDIDVSDPTTFNGDHEAIGLSPASSAFRSALDLKLTRLQRDVLRMGALVESSCLLAREALCDRNIDAAKHLKKHDKQVDQLYRQIEVDCVNLITLEAPVTRDLRLVSALMQMIRDLERIGDYAKDIGEVSLKLFPYPVHGTMDQIQIMLDRCRSMVAMSLLSLSELDVNAGHEIKKKDDVVDDDYDRLYELLVQTPPIAGNVEPTVLLVLVIRYLERIADHATNIGRRVVFVVTGERH